MNIDVRLNLNMEANQKEREALIREYERRIAVLKSGGSPSEVIFQRDRTAVSSERITSDDGREIAEISFLIKTLPSFQREDAEMILHHFADMSRSFYLKAGNALKAAKPENVSMEDAIRNCATEMFRTFTKNAKDGGCIVLTEDDLREDERLVLGQGTIIEMEKPLRVNIRAAREGLPIAIPMKGAETRLEAALRAVEKVKKVYHDAEICVEVDV